MTGRVQNKVALVTGAARSIGRACALRLADEGADLILLDIGVVSRMETVPTQLASAGDLSDVVAEVRARGRRVVSRYVDVRDGDALGAAVRAGVGELGSLDIAVAAARVRSEALAWEMSEVQWRTMIDVNLTGAWQTAKAVAPVMAAQGHGSIVLIGSALVRQPVRGHAHEAAAKHGVQGLVRSFALELAPRDVRVNSVDPGPLDSPRAAGAHSGDRHGDEPAVDGRSAIRADDVADAVLFLASDEARSVTGTSLLVDRGASLSG